MKTLLSITLALVAILSAPAQELINLGSSANDGTGDKLRAAGIKINTNTFNFDRRLDNIEAITNLVGTGGGSAASQLLSNIVASATNTVFLNISSNLPAAISNVANNTRIRLAGGTYTITPSKVLSNGIGAINLFNKSNIILESEEGAILDGSGALGELLYATNVNGLVIRGITFKGMVVTNYTLVSAIGHVHGTLGLYDVQHVTIDGCRFIDGHDHGIYDLGSQPNWNNTSTNNIRILNSYLTNFGSKRTNEAVSIDGTAIVPTAGWWIQGNEFYGNLRDIEPYIEGDATSNLGYGVMIIGNRFRNTIENSILPAGSTNSQFATIAGNHFERDVGYTRRGTNIISSASFIYWNGSHGWRIVGNDFRGQTYAGIWALAGVRDGIISGNRFFDLTNSLGTGGLGIQLETVYNFSVTDNDIRRSEAQSIYIYGARDSEVSRNTIVNPAGEVGIQIATLAPNVSSNVTFSGNRIIGADTPFWDQGLSGSLSLRFYGNEAPGSSDLSTLTVDTITWDTTGGLNQVATKGNLNTLSNALGSVSGTNQPFVFSGGTLTLIANQTSAHRHSTNASAAFTFSGTPNASSRAWLLASNSHASSTIYLTNTSGIYDPEVGSNVTTFAIAPASVRTFLFGYTDLNGWTLLAGKEKLSEIGPGMNTDLSTNAGVVSVVGKFSFSTNGSAWIQATNLIARSGIVLSNDAAGTVSFHVAASGTSGPTTNAPPYVLSLGGTGSTNIVLDFAALVSTNTVRVTLTANAGLVVTNVVDGKRVVLELIQDSNGYRTLATNGATANNIRFSDDLPFWTQGTNATRKDLLSFTGSGTNALLTGQLKGFLP